MRFVYQGVPSGVTLSDGTEVLFADNKELELPEDNEYVKTLVALGHLKEVVSKKTKKEVSSDAS